MGYGSVCDYLHGVVGSGKILAKAQHIFWKLL